MTTTTGSKELSMDNLISMYEALGDDMFNIDFTNLTAENLNALNDAVDTLKAKGQEITFQALLDTGNLTQEVANTIQVAQLYADANAITVSIEAVKKFNVEEDRFNAENSKEFIDNYNKLMGYGEDDENRLTADKMALMTDAELADLQFRSTQAGSRMNLDTA
jgi:hypothetical protein